MATLTKTYDFAADAQGFIASAGSAASVMSWTGGVLQTALTGVGKSDTNSWALTTTFEAMGVPAGSIITGITTNSAQAKCTTFASGSGCTNGAVTLVCNGVTVTLSAQRAFTTTDAGFVTTNGTDNGATNFGSNEAVTLTIPNHRCTTAGGSGKSVTLQQDNVVFTITYIDANLLLAKEVSVRSRAPKPAYYMLSLGIIQDVQTLSDSISESVTLADTTDATASLSIFPIVGARLRSRAPKPALYSVLQGILPVTASDYSDSVSETLSLVDATDGTTSLVTQTATRTIYTPRRRAKAVTYSILQGVLELPGPTSNSVSVSESMALVDTSDGPLVQDIITRTPLYIYMGAAAERRQSRMRRAPLANDQYLPESLALTDTVSATTTGLTLDKTAARAVYSRARPLKRLFSITQGTLPDTAPLSINASVSESMALLDSDDSNVNLTTIKRTPLYIYLGAAAERRAWRTSRSPLAVSQNAAVNEAVSLTSTVSTQIDWLPSVIEAINLSTGLSIGTILAAAGTEVISFIDTESAVLASSDEDGETVSLADSLDAFVTRSGVAVGEGLVTNDLYLARTTASASRSETITLLDSTSATIHRLVAVQETMALRDTPAGRGVMSVNFSDRIFPSDSTDATVPGSGPSGGGDYLINRRRRK